MAGRGKKKQKIDYSNVIWRVGAYTRRSFDDMEDTESNTITNQKDLIKNYLKNEPNTILVDYYDDDGYSGTTFNRPGFQRLFRDIVTGEVNTIIIKDLSRLGRNYTEVGKYIENIFPIYNVRIISINDNLDSWKDPKTIDSMIVPIKNLMNDEYARDISKKVKSAYATMAKNGKYASGTPPYGYSIDPDDKHHLIINAEEAKNVKKIFNMALNGDGRIKICKYLNENGILCRKELQRRIKHNLSLNPFEIDSRYIWSLSTIGRILSSETYIGNLVQNKTTNVSYKNKNIIYKPKEDWIIVPNTHEPIISKDKFQKVQKIISSKSFKKRNTKNDSAYDKLIKCADCGRAMYKVEDFRGNRNTSNYYCMSYMHLGKVCTKHKIKMELLNQLVIEAIKVQIKLVIEFNKSLEKLHIDENIENINNDYENMMAKYNKKIDTLKEQKKLKYEEWKFDKISKDEFLVFSKNNEDSIKEINNKIDQLQINHDKNIKESRLDTSWINHFKRNSKIKKINKKVLNELIECIYVHEKSNINIVFKYKDEFNETIKYLKERGVYDEKMENSYIC